MLTPEPPAETADHHRSARPRTPGWDACSSLELAGHEEPSTTRRRPSAVRRGPRSTLRSLVEEHLGSTTKFLLVGGIVFLLDAAMYNLLVFWHPAHGWGEGLMHGSPLPAKVLTIAAASCLTYLGNRLWTFGDRPRPDTSRSILLFVLINVIASGLQLSCLGFSRYVLGLDSVLADNISGTLIGQAVSTSFRYVTYGRFVFPRR
ncbi:GtrA family protein [Brachybacterium alimentarium]|uniref:GtrA family protein n=1 Tax=Brachybacterium alimentarium TaxID=47845 RepID=UPI003FD2037C